MITKLKNKLQTIKRFMIWLVDFYCKCMSRHFVRHSLLSLPPLSLSLFLFMTLICCSLAHTKCFSMFTILFITRRHIVKISTAAAATTTASIVTTSIPVTDQDQASTTMCHTVGLMQQLCSVVSFVWGLVICVLVWIYIFIYKCRHVSAFLSLSLCVCVSINSKAFWNALGMICMCRCEGAFVC